jgi:hypothetical protein
MLGKTNSTGPPQSTTTTILMPMAFPLLYLYPFNAGSFIKQINNQNVDVARLTNACTISAEI